MNRDELQAILERQDWIFSKSRPEIPHWYTLRAKWGDDKLFDTTIQSLREHSYTEYFYRRPYQYVNFGEFKYWTMGAPIEKTILINRARI